ncbi:MAG: hypothetical protein DLM73_14875 [Chthoniobacterales bacterium]|nr:MAG: hypothetical protein DLM73_14875 [Chthoniobacterales bacterium]
MPDTPSIPPAKDPFEKRVALTIAIIAISNSFVANLGDNAKTSSILKTSDSLDQWGYFQAKSTKAQIAAMHGDILMRLSTDERAGDTRSQAIKLGQEARRYDVEKAEIKTKAEGLAGEAAHFSAINNRCDQASLLLQIAVVICSVSILAQSHKFWWLGMCLGVAGVVVGATAYFI